ncbi:hypothetical protein LOTGIDRAFT_158306 [Lottia gigantea]|uniref:L-dopachrome isomerase n=1 Tax=Lottia gigantea TaxID=225164 RepID=V4A7X7_LOTGI|nr:hypothetical protein LOTGIDRAFT_158306 [Lottia gigantea]ESP00074.1 hypothetical protein LOTGIDRAFT_158306 [Lottia gigantea]
MVNVCAVLKTNVHEKSIQKDFLSKFSDFLVTLTGADLKNITLELYTDVTMMRAGTTAPMLNIDFVHNSPQIDQTSKYEYANKITQFICIHLHIPEDRLQQKVDDELHYINNSQTKIHRTNRTW